MKLNTTDFRRKLQHPLVMALSCFPLVMYMLAQSAPEAVGLMWVLPASYVLLAWVCLLLPGKLRLLGGLVSIAAMIAVTAAVWPIAAHPVLIVPLIVYAVLMLIALPMGRWERGREVGLEWPVIGMCTHVLVQLLINGAQKLGNTAFDDCEGVLVISFLMLAVLVVLALNRQSLNSASQSRQNVPLLMRRQNLVLVIAVLVIGVLIAMVPAIGSALTWVWDRLMQLLLLLGSLLSTLMGEKKTGGGAEGGGVEESEILGTATETSWWALLMEKVMTVMVVIILAVGAVFILWMLAKQLRKLMRYLWEKLGKYSAAVGEDYEDEVTSTREEDVERESLLGRLRRLAPEDVRGLDATQRVRSRYRSLKRRRQWTTSATARETLPEEAARLYERARYSGEALTDEEAERFRDETKKV